MIAGSPCWSMGFHRLCLYLDLVYLMYSLCSGTSRWNKQIIYVQSRFNMQIKHLLLKSLDFSLRNAHEKKNNIAPCCDPQQCWCRRNAESRAKCLVTAVMHTAPVPLFVGAPGALVYQRKNREKNHQSLDLGAIFAFWTKDVPIWICQNPCLGKLQQLELPNLHNKNGNKNFANAWEDIRYLPGMFCHLLSVFQPLTCLLFLFFQSIHIDWFAINFFQSATQPTQSPKLKPWLLSFNMAPSPRPTKARLRHNNQRAASTRNSCQNLWE